MASIDGQIRKALKERLTTALALPGPGDDASTYRPIRVLTYQDGASRPGDGPFVLIEVGGWSQSRLDESNAPGQRVWTRKFQAEFACVADTTDAEFSEVVQGLSDRVIAALADFTTIVLDCKGLFQDLSVENGGYFPFDSHEGTAGQFVLSAIGEVLLDERAIQVAGGGVPSSLFL